MNQSSDSKETLERVKELYTKSLHKNEVTESTLLSRIRSRPSVAATDGSASLKKHREYEALARATLRLDSNYGRRLCLSLQRRARQLTEQITSRETILPDQLNLAE